MLSLSLSDHEFAYCIRKLNWMKVKVSGIMQSTTRPSFVMTLEMLIGMFILLDEKYLQEQWYFSLI